MKYIKLYEKYINNNTYLILEKNIEVGDNLLKKLNNINKPFANKLKDFLLTNDFDDDVKIHKIDFDENDNKLFTLIDNNGKERKFKLGKLFKQIGFDDSNVKKYEIEDFVNNFRKVSIEDLKVVKGEEIKDSYLESNYDIAKKGSYSDLHTSCMRFRNAQEYLEIYTTNPNQVSCLTLFNNDGKVMGRALLWNLDDGNVFMDRIYTIYSEHKAIFYKYRDKHNISNKVTSNVTLENGGEFDYYPYMDTMLLYDPDTSVLSDSDGEYRLDSTTGSHSSENTIYSELYGEHIDNDEAVYCEHLGSYIYKHDAVRVYNSDGSDEWGLSGHDELVEITYTSEKFAEYKGFYAKEDDACELENSDDDYVLVDDDEICDNSEFGAYLKADAFTEEEFNNIDYDMFAIKITSDLSDYFDEYIPIIDAMSIWSVDEGKILVIDEYLFDDFESEYDEEYNQINVKSGSNELTNTLYLPVKFYDNDIISVDAPVYYDITSESLKTKGEDTVQLNQGLNIEKDDIKKYCFKSNNTHKIFPPLMRYNGNDNIPYNYDDYEHYRYFYTKNFANKKQKESSSIDFKKYADLYFGLLDDGVKLENSIYDGLKDKTFYTLECFRNYKEINNKFKNSKIFNEIKKFTDEEIIGDLFSQDKDNVSFFYSYYNIDGLFIFPFINKNDEYFVYDTRETDKIDYNRIKMLTASKIHDLTLDTLF